MLELDLTIGVEFSFFFKTRQGKTWENDGLIHGTALLTPPPLQIPLFFVPIRRNYGNIFILNFAERRGDRGRTERNAHERVRGAFGTGHQAAGVLRIQSHALSRAMPRFCWPGCGWGLAGGFGRVRVRRGGTGLRGGERAGRDRAESGSCKRTMMRGEGRRGGGGIFVFSLCVSFWDSLFV